MRYAHVYARHLSSEQFDFSHPEPNTHVSRAVIDAEVRISERIDRQVEMVENRFKTIDGEMERRILGAFRALDESLNVVSRTLSGLLDDDTLVNTRNSAVSTVWTGTFRSPKTDDF